MSLPLAAALLLALALPLDAQEEPPRPGPRHNVEQLERIEASMKAALDDLARGRSRLKDLQQEYAVEGLDAARTAEREKLRRALFAGLTSLQESLIDHRRFARTIEAGAGAGLITELFETRGRLGAKGARMLQASIQTEEFAMETGHFFRACLAQLAEEEQAYHAARAEAVSRERTLWAAGLSLGGLAALAGLTLARSRAGSRVRTSLPAPKS